METSPSIPFPSHPTEAKPSPREREGFFSSRIKEERERERIRNQQTEEENKQLAEAAHSIQTGLITTQIVQPVEQLLSPPLLSVYEQNKDFFGDKAIPFSDDLGKGEFRMKVTQNNIVMLQEKRKQPNFFFFFPRYSIEKFYYIDRQNNKAWDVIGLLKESETSSPFQLLNIPSFQNSAVADTKVGHVIILNPLSDMKDKDKIAKKLRLSPSDVELLDILAPLHEIGHHFQHSSYDSRDSLEMAFVKDYLVHKFIFPLLSFFTKIGLDAGASKTLELVKKRFTWKERNAHAFALSITHKLKQQQTDLFRGFSVDDITSVVDKALISHDKILGKLLPGLPFSQLLRKAYRKAGLA